MICNQCPRKCNINRSDNGLTGFCKADNNFIISRCDLHMFEEPCISGKVGSGTIFFSGCNLQCIFCQNKNISQKINGVKVSNETLLQMMLDLQSKGASNINLVTPTHYSLQLLPVLKNVKPLLNIPVLWNSSGYELPETVHALSPFVDIWMPDLKYYSSFLSKEFSKAEDYYTVAIKAIKQMYSDAGPVKFNSNGMMTSGVLIRHLVLPGHRDDSIRILENLKEEFPIENIRISIMNQYTPDFAMDTPFPELHRKVTTFEYLKVVNKAADLGYLGYMQYRASSSASYTPDFEGSIETIKKIYKN